MKKAAVYFKFLLACILSVSNMVCGQKKSSKDVSIQDYEIIKTSKPDKVDDLNKEILLMTFEYHPAKENLLNLKEGKYQYFFSKSDEKSSKIELRDFITKRIVPNSTIYIPGIPPINNCKAQEIKQWENFNKNILPGLQKLANQNCRSVYYCLTITCNGIPTKSSLIMISPNWRLCSIKMSASAYKDLIIRSFK